MPDEAQNVTSRACESKSRPTSLNLSTYQLGLPTGSFSLNSEFITPNLGGFLQNYNSANSANHIQAQPINQNNGTFSDVLQHTGRSANDEISNGNNLISLNFAVINPATLGKFSNGINEQKPFILFSSPTEARVSSHSLGASLNPGAFIISADSNLINNPKLEENNSFLLTPNDTQNHIRRSVDSVNIRQFKDNTISTALGTTSALDDPFSCQDDLSETNQSPRNSSVSSTSNLKLKDEAPFNWVKSDPKEQRLERKRARNRNAARKCRERKINLIKSLEKEVNELSEENQQLRSKLTQTHAEIDRLRVFMKLHVESVCPVVSKS